MAMGYKKTTEIQSSLPNVHFKLGSKLSTAEPLLLPLMPIYLPRTRKLFAEIKLNLTNLTALIKDI